jgi:hypothetical protein
MAWLVCTVWQTFLEECLLKLEEISNLKDYRLTFRCMNIARFGILLSLVSICCVSSSPMAWVWISLNPRPHCTHCTLASKLCIASIACTVHVYSSQFQAQAWLSSSFGLIRFLNFFRIGNPSFGKRVSDFIIVCFIFPLVVKSVELVA